MSAGVHMAYRVVPAVCIQVQPVPAVGVLLGETRDHGVVVPCPQVVLPGQGIPLLPGVQEAVGYGFPADCKVPSYVIFVVVQDFPVIRHMGGTSQFVGGIVFISANNNTISP